VNRRGFARRLGVTGYAGGIAATTLCVETRVSPKSLWNWYTQEWIRVLIPEY